MGKSFKKNACCTCAKDNAYKKIYNRKIRRNNKLEVYPSGGYYRRLNEPWMICDFKSRCNSFSEFVDSYKKYHSGDIPILELLDYYEKCYLRK